MKSSAWILVFTTFLFDQTSPNAATLFSDNFNSGVASPEWVTKSCCQRVQNGWYYLQDTDGGARDAHALVHDSDPSWRDYRVSLKGQFIPTSRWEFLAVAFRTNNFSRTSAGCTGTAYMFEVRGGGFGEPDQVQLWRFDCTAGRQITLLGSKITPIPTTPMDVVVQAQGGRLQAFLNGTQLLDTVDPKPFLSGGVGVHTVWEAAAQFDDVVVESFASIGPDGLAASATSPTQVLLEWNNLLGAKTYRLARKNGDCAAAGAWETRIDTRATQSWDSGLTPGSLYSYRVAGDFGSGSLSQWSTCVTTRTGVTGSPMQPSSVTHLTEGVTAQSETDSRVLLRWSDESANETSFIVYRKSGAGVLKQIATAPSNSVSFRDTTAVGNTGKTAYAYDIRACNAAGCSSGSPSPVSVPFAPTNLKAVASGTAVKLSWTDTSSDESSFEITRRNGDCAATNAASAYQYARANSTAFTDAYVVSNTTYSYRVRAQKGNKSKPIGYGFSGYSNCVAITVP